MTSLLTSSGMLVRPRSQHRQRSSSSLTASPVCSTRLGQILWVFAWSGVHGVRVEAVHWKRKEAILWVAQEVLFGICRRVVQLRPWWYRVSVCGCSTKSKMTLREAYLQET